MPSDREQNAEYRAVFLIVRWRKRGGEGEGIGKGDRMLETRNRINGQSRKKGRKKRKKKRRRGGRERERDAAKGLVEMEGGRRKRELSSGPTNPALPTPAPQEKGSLKRGKE